MQNSERKESRGPEPTRRFGEEVKPPEPPPAPVPPPTPTTAETLLVLVSAVADLRDQIAHLRADMANMIQAEKLNGMTLALIADKDGDLRKYGFRPMDKRTYELNRMLALWHNKNREKFYNEFVPLPPAPAPQPQPVEPQVPAATGTAEGEEAPTAQV